MACYHLPGVTCDECRGYLMTTVTPAPEAVFPPSHAVLISEIATLRARVEELEAALVEIWSSVPATYDNDDPMVQRHARALNAVAALLKEQGK